MSSARPKHDQWLASYMPELTRFGPLVVELGCGTGLDAGWLLARGFRVAACDRSAEALHEASRNTLGARFFRSDVGAPLPLRDGCTGIVVASLSLHYLPWAGTLTAFAEVSRVLRPGGVFVFRVNASDDLAHGAGQGEVLEPGFFRSDGRAAVYSETKRFFDEQMVRAALGSAFAVERLEHVTTTRFVAPKQTWECLARRV